MEQTVTQPEIKAPKPELNGQSAPPAPAQTLTPARPTKHPARMVLEGLADLRITVATFALALVLVFWGTLAQTDAGVWTIVRTYFRSFYVFVPLKVVFFNMVEETALKLPFPGGFLIGTVMMINLLAAHAVRFKLAWNRTGIILIHAGIIIMMLGEIITHLYAVENHMKIRVGQTTNVVVDSRTCELAIIRLDPDDVRLDHQVVVPARYLKDGAHLDDPNLPFKVEVIRFMVNSALTDGANNLATMGFGKVHVAEKRPEVSGVDTNDMDAPSAYVRLSSRDGKELGVWLVSTNFADPKWQWVELDKQKFKIALRFKETTRDFTMHLRKFDHKLFQGTATPKDYRSHIHLSDKIAGEERDVEIFMNAPLYYKGETFYQSGMNKDMTGTYTILAVVRNPGWTLPYISCAVVGLGLLMHFGLTLFRFLERRTVR